VSRKLPGCSISSLHRRTHWQVREQVYLTTRRKYLEVFINDKQLERDTASMDFGTGMATLPFVREDQLSGFNIATGILSSGSAETSISNPTDDKSETAFVWNGAQLEILITFPDPAIVNRLRIELDDYQGLAVDVLTSSPDGILVDDLLLSVPSANRFIDGSSNKFSGDWVVDFDPKHVKQLRIVLSDRVGDERIALRGLTLSAVRYQTTGKLQPRLINFNVQSSSKNLMPVFSFFLLLEPRKVGAQTWVIGVSAE
jgi:hypothetical protein